MRKILTFICLLLITNYVTAQKLNPELKNGSKLSYLVYLGDQEIPLQMTINKSNGALAWDWSVDGYGSGTFQMSEQAIENATKLFNTSQPNLGVTKLADDETFGLISKKAFQSLVNTKEFEYNKIKFKGIDSTSTFKLNGKEVDAILVKGEAVPLQLWILNNETYPLILKTIDNELDLVLVDIK